jgi:hypothetical protein
MVGLLMRETLQQLRREFVIAAAVIGLVTLSAFVLHRLSS